ncbi:MAG: AI-2E family transporter [Clostridia bacterium]|nr:AI-2E family transporter [Clostridia bacterium]MBQ9995768.1 AI-2E family transporter [Clostridia bacterium]
MTEPNIKRRGFPQVLLTAVLALILIEFFMKYIGGALLPFILAYVASRMIRPAGVFLSRKCRISEKSGCAVFAVLVCIGTAYGIALFAGSLAGQLWDVIGNLPEYAEKAAELFGGLLDLLPFTVDSESRMFRMISDALADAAASVGTSAASFLGGIVGAVPGSVFSAVVAIFAFVYLTADPAGIAESLLGLLPDRTARKTERIFGEVSGAVFLYLRTYLTIMTVTFLELSVGLTVIGVKYALAASLIVAVIDVLPVLGCGCVLVPWAVWEFLYGEQRRGISLLVLLGVIYLVRQLLDSRLIGKMTGVHPFVALVCLYLGWHIGGVGGMIAAPVILCAVRSLERAESEDGYKI